MLGRVNFAASALYNAGSTEECNFSTAMQWAIQQYEWEIEAAQFWMTRYTDLKWTCDLEMDRIREFRLAGLIYEMHQFYIEDEDQARELTLAELRCCGAEDRNSILLAVADCLEDGDYSRLAL